MENSKKKKLERKKIYDYLLFILDLKKKNFRIIMLVDKERIVVCFRIMYFF